MSDPEAELNAKYPERKAIKEIIRSCDYDKDSALHAILSSSPYIDRERLDLVLDTIDLHKIQNAFETADTRANMAITKNITIAYDTASKSANLQSPTLTTEEA